MAPRLLVHAVPAALRLPAAEAFAAIHGHSDDVFWLDDHAGWSVFGAGERWVPGGSGPVLGSLSGELASLAAGDADADAGSGAESDAAALGLLEGLAWRPGLVGWLGYGLTAETMGVPVAQPAPRGEGWAARADAVARAGGVAHAGGAGRAGGAARAGGAGRADAVAAFLRVGRAVAVANDGRMLLVAHGTDWDGPLADWRDHLLTLLAEQRDPGERGDQGSAAPSGSDVVADGSAANRAAAPVWLDDRRSYVAKVRECQEAIRRGDAYVLNLTTEVVVEGVRQDALEVFLRLRAAAPTRHGGLVRIGGVSLISSSPESFLELDGAGGVATRPVKGTRPRSSEPRLDRALRDELAASPKERAENTMIVDLMRNDLARVAVPGSVEVTALLEVESVRQVHQLVSTVRARLADGAGVVDALGAAFPAGSMTGAPKRSAVEILDRLEARPRGLYSGAFGFVGADGRAGLAMTIRSIVLEGSLARVGVGGGVTALSDPDDEYDEVLLKARALLEALA